MAGKAAVCLLLSSKIIEMQLKGYLAMSEQKLNETLLQGINLLEAGDVRAALSLLEKYSKEHQDDPDGYFYLGDALAEDGCIDDAIVSYRAGLKLVPDDADALTTLGDLLFEAGQHDAAIASYSRVRELDAEDADALVSIGLVHSSLDKSDEAIAAYRQAL